jgi:4-oxalocrotonate tautomerase
MPIVNIQLLEGRSVQQKAEISRVITDALVEIGGAERNAVLVIFSDIEKSDLAKGGKLVSEV